MRSVTEIILLTVLVQAHAKESTGNHLSNAEDSDDEVENLVGKLVDQLHTVPARRSPFVVPRTSVKMHATGGNSAEKPFLKKFFTKAAIMGSFLSLGGAALLGGPMTPLSIAAQDEVGQCVVTSCQKELAACIVNPKCLANVICLNSCAGRKDEGECQLKCGDYFENDVIGTFNACAVSQKKCVPQKKDEGLYPIPPIASQVKQFDTTMWNGRWYISAGLNKAFDTFDCQVHFFNSPYPGKFYAKLFWRINEPDGEFFTKDTVQRFVQDPQNPAHLINHDNEYLHYMDDWYVLDYEKDDFVLVYYRGSNDAWDGYGGAFVYSRSPTLRPELIPRLEAAVARTEGPWKWKDFSTTDNSCKVEEDPSVLREKFAKRAIIQTEDQLAEALTVVRSNALDNIDRTEKGAEKSIQSIEKEAESFVKELGKDALIVEKEIAKDVLGVGKQEPGAKQATGSLASLLTAGRPAPPGSGLLTNMIDRSTGLLNHLIPLQDVHNQGGGLLTNIPNQGSGLLPAPSALHITNQGSQLLAERPSDIVSVSTMALMIFIVGCGVTFTLYCFRRGITTTGEKSLLQAH